MMIRSQEDTLGILHDPSCHGHTGSHHILILSLFCFPAAMTDFHQHLIGKTRDKERKKACRTGDEERMVSSVNNRGL